MPRSFLHEVPPTAGLPPHWRDLGFSRTHSLAECAAEFLGVDEVQIECSGTAALVVALTVLKRRSARTSVVVPAYTCPLVAIAVAHCGLKLRLCDLAPDGIDMDAAALAALCDEDTLAIVPTHLAGRVADVDTAVACARHAGAWVIEDAAQALGARFADGSAAGTRGDIGFFSLAVGKGLTTYEGGLLVARDAALRTQLRRCREDLVPFDAAWEFKRTLKLLGYHAFYRPAGLAFVYGLPRRRALRAGDATAAVGDDFPLSIPLHRLGAWRQSVGARAFVRLRDFLDAGAAQARRRCARLAQIPGIDVVGDDANAQGTWPFLLLRLPSHASRDAALAELWTTPLGVSRLFIHALPDYAYLAAIVPAAAVPNARDFAARTLTVSNSPWLDDEGFEHIRHTLERIVQ
ncbi:MAG: DegT/DnrJ/EryC1/StrS family aminotransferase [Rudaea sp.]|uniref:DegT/DnrJ/EryC1/StrS family aminotransferase n=1 Tax=Rudaea sp. TaxID=2136325 RepID=UPI0039E6394E